MSVCNKTVLRTSLPKCCCEPGCLLVSQPRRVALLDLNYRAVTDWLTAGETGSRPAESTERGAGVCRFIACVLLVGGQDVENTVWNHKSWNMVCVADRQASIVADILMAKKHTHTLGNKC